MPYAPSSRAVCDRAQRCAAALLLMVSLSTAPATANDLEGHPSPYLAMHGQDPVAWQTWNGSPVERARREGKLMYVSVGYFSCHWCHVMHRESYLDPGIAQLLNANFVPIKIDRELQPALDNHLMNFMVATRGHGGWPLNVFLTPEGYPLYATTYLPADQFRALIERVDERWREDRAQLTEAAMQAAAAIDSARPALESRRLDPSTAREYETAFVRDTARLADLDNGGFGTRGKFPTTPQLRLLLKMAAERPDPVLRDFLRLTLDRMADRGMRDHLDGGFFRYTTDPEWRVPHFEKMLYDNALIAELYLDAGELLGEPAYRSVATHTLGFMLREFWQGGAFIASLSAVDADMVEGGYYLWQDATLERVMSADERAVATIVWNFQGVPTLEHGRLPARAAPDEEVAQRLDMPPEQVARVRGVAHARLMAERSKRSLPRDIKLLAGWNGLALAVLARAAAMDDDPSYRRASERLRNTIASRLWDGKQLMRAIGHGGGAGTASLEDYAYVARGLLAHAEVSGATGDLDLVRRIVDAAWRRFRVDGGWRQSEDVLIPYGSPDAVLADGVLPSPSATLIDTTLRLAARTGDAALHARAVEVLWTASSGLVASPFAYATHIGLLRSHPPPAN